MKNKKNLLTKEVWLASIENAAEEVASKIGVETVSFVLSNYGVKSFEDIPSTKMPEVFNELQLLAEGNIY